MLERKIIREPCQDPPEHTIELPFAEPYDWETVLAFFRAHQLPHLEAVDESGYERVVRMRRGLGWFRVELVKAVRPWRGYAAVALWKSFAESKTKA